jgi:hypothetical protein
MLSRVRASSPLGLYGPVSGRAGESYAADAKSHQELYLDLLGVVHQLHRVAQVLRQYNRCTTPNKSKYNSWCDLASAA